MSDSYDRLYNIRVRLFPEQVGVMKQLAARNRRSLAAEIRVAVDRYVEAQVPETLDQVLRRMP